MGSTRQRGTRPDFVLGFDPAAVSEAEILRRGADLFNAGSYWEAHEVWEQAWRRRAGRRDRDFLKGLIQGAAGMWHASQGNYVGAVSVLGRAIEYLGPYRPARDGVAVTDLIGWLTRNRDRSAAALRDGEPPRLEPPGLLLAEPG